MGPQESPPPPPCHRPGPMCCQETLKTLSVITFVLLLLWKIPDTCKRSKAFIGHLLCTRKCQELQSGDTSSAGECVAGLAGVAAPDKPLGSLHHQCPLGVQATPTLCTLPLPPPHCFEANPNIPFWLEVLHLYL